MAKASRSPKPVPGSPLTCGRPACKNPAAALGAVWPQIGTAWCGVCLTPSELRAIRSMSDTDLLRLPEPRHPAGMGLRGVVEIRSLRERGLVGNVSGF